MEPNFVMRPGKKKNANPEEHTCKILITCGQPSLDGKMHVEMTYEGDPALASYMLARAQYFVDQDEEQNSY